VTASSFLLLVDSRPQPNIRRLSEQSMPDETSHDLPDRATDQPDRRHRSLLATAWQRADDLPIKRPCLCA
jgi:hypothetical protein